MIHIMTSINGVSYNICVWWDINEGGVKEKETNSVPKMVCVLGPEKTEPNLLEHLTLFGHGSLQSLTIVLHASGN